jgi:hypothetical protein
LAKSQIPHGHDSVYLSAAQNNFEADWVDADGGAILRQCPICLCDSIMVTPPGEIMEVLQIYLRLERPLTNSPSLYSSR